MKKDILTVVFVFLFSSIFITSNSFGQARTHEIGVRFQSVDSREFIYKRSSIENRFMRYRAGNASLTNVIGQGTNVANFSLAFAIGRESRKRISEDFSFVHGPELGMEFASVSGNDISQYVWRPQIGYILGFQYDISKKVYVSAELIPTIGATFFPGSRTNTIVSIDAGFGPKSIALTAAYRFAK